MLCSVMAGVYSGLNVLVKVSVDVVFHHGRYLWWICIPAKRVL